MPTSTHRTARVTAAAATFVWGAVLGGFALAGCGGRTSVDDEARPFDAATETVRAEAAQLAARADARLRTATDSSDFARLRASRDSLLTALDALAASSDTASAESRRAISDLGTRVLARFRSADSAAAAAQTPR